MFDNIPTSREVPAIRYDLKIDGQWVLMEYDKNQIPSVTILKTGWEKASTLTKLVSVITLGMQKPTQVLLFEVNLYLWLNESIRLQTSF